MSEIMSGAASTPKIAAFLLGLKTKGESVAELTALADTMLEHAVRIEVPGRTLDIVGTGGDRSHTVNISTMSALVIAGAGITVVKHGNRAASSSSGSADVLEALGIRLDHPPARVAELATEVGITFCFAQVFHPSFRHTAAARTELGIGTAFNFLGPLTNPAQPRSAAIGVAEARMAPLLAGVLAGRGASALVFRGEDGLDEIAPTGPTRIWEVRDGGVTESVIDWETDLGVERITLESLRGAKADYNADVARRLLDGAGRSRPRDRRAQRRGRARGRRHPARHRRRHARRAPGRRERARARGAGQRRGRGRAGALAGCQRALRGQSGCSWSD